MTRRRDLSPEDQSHWAKVARTAKPLPGRAMPTPVPVLPPHDGKPRKPPKPDEPTAAPRVGPPPTGGRIAPVETKILRQIRRGQIAIEARLDLHGATQKQAHARLAAFLTTARQRGVRIVLIVTGTGVRRQAAEAGSALAGEQPGVLRRVLPGWLGAPPFATWVMGLSPAAPHHGGAGAFYVVLRREKAA